MRDITEQLLQQMLDKHGISHQLFDQMLKEERTRVHLRKRREVTRVLRHIIEQNPKKDSK